MKTETAVLDTTNSKLSGTYVTTETTQNLTLGTHNVTAKYLRTANILNETITNKKYINLSPKKKGCGRAYYELTFAEAIKSLSLDLAAWSSSDLKQMFSDEDYVANIYIKKMKSDGTIGWVFVTDLRTVLTQCIPNFQTLTCREATGIMGIKIDMANANTGSSNGARLSIDKITLNP